MTYLPGGTQYTLAADGYEATVTAVGASLRSLTFGGRPLVATWPETEIRPVSRGAVLAPWPNRVADGTYSWRGQKHQLDLTEPTRHNASHGLVRWATFEAVTIEPHHLALETTIVPRPGYPWPVKVTVDYRLTAEGLTWSVEATNLGDSEAPYGVAIHPYLVAPSSRLDEWRAKVPADTYLPVSEDRMLPLGPPSETVVAVDGTAFDLRDGPVIGARELDNAYTAVHGDDAGRARVEVTDPNGAGAAITWSTEHFPWVQVHTADKPGSADDRLGLAVEPMTCPPDAFSSGEDVVALAPGEPFLVEWHIEAI